MSKWFEFDVIYECTPELNGTALVEVDDEDDEVWAERFLRSNLRPQIDPHGQVEDEGLEMAKRRATMIMDKS